jgi:DNA-binding NarL/FixJ family response regulator
MTAPAQPTSGQAALAGSPPVQEDDPDQADCPDGPGRCPSRLTVSEVNVILRIAAGLTDEAVATACRLSPHTVRHHVASAMRRASARSRTELVAKCFAAGVLVAAWPPALSASACLCRLAGGRSPSA